MAFAARMHVFPGGRVDPIDAQTVVDLGWDDAERARQADVRARLAALTLRERAVLERVLAGRLNKVIADELAISIKTVEAHRARMMEKLGAHSVAELVQLTLTADPTQGGR